MHADTTTSIQYCMYNIQNIDKSVSQQHNYAIHNDDVAEFKTKMCYITIKQNPSIMSGTSHL